MKKMTLLTGFLLVSLITFSQTDNTFTGSGAGNSNTTGDYNTFTGSLSGYKNTSGSNFLTTAYEQEASTVYFALRQSLFRFAPNWQHTPCAVCHALTRYRRFART